MMKRLRRKIKLDGFTLTEVLISISITALLILSFIGFIVWFNGYVFSYSKNFAERSDLNSLLAFVQEETYNCDAVLKQNESTIVFLRDGEKRVLRTGSGESFIEVNGVKHRTVPIVLRSTIPLEEGGSIIAGFCLMIEDESGQEVCFGKRYVMSVLREYEKTELGE